MVKNPPVMQETEVQSLGQEDSLEEGMATHSSIFAWRIPWTEEEATVRGVTNNKVTNTHTIGFHFWRKMALESEVGVGLWVGKQREEQKWKQRRGVMDTMS